MSRDVTLMERPDWEIFYPSSGMIAVYAKYPLCMTYDVLRRDGGVMGPPLLVAPRSRTQAWAVARHTAEGERQDRAQAPP